MAETYCPDVPEPFAAESFERDGISKLPAAISIREAVVDRRRSQGDIDVWASGSFDDQRAMVEMKKGNRLPFEEVKRIYETEWSAVGFEDDYQEGEYKKDGLEQLRTFYAAMMESLPEILEQEKSFELDLENNVVMKGESIRSIRWAAKTWKSWTTKRENQEKIPTRKRICN